MTSNQFKSTIQSELKHEGFAAKIVKVAEDENGRTTIQFESQINPELFRWLNARFSKEVTAINENSVCLNHPNCDLISN